MAPQAANTVQLLGIQLSATPAELAQGDAARVMPAMAKSSGMERPLMRVS